MTAEEALEILAQRRGKMYDPLVVDTFVREHGALRAEGELLDLPTMLLGHHSEAHSPADSTTEPQSIHPAPSESLRLLSSLSPFPDGPSLDMVCRHLVASIRAIAPFDTVAIYVLEETSSDAVAIFVDGAGGHALAGLRIPIAERMTGWVAAHRTAVWNTDAALDLDSQATAIELTLGSSLPLCTGEVLTGVMSMYGRPHQEITMAQRRALESLLPTIASSLNTALRRPAFSINCVNDDVRAAAMAALDALLSHDRHSSDGAARSSVLAVTNTKTASDTRHPARRSDADAELCARLSPHVSPPRCVLRVSPGNLLLFALDNSTAEQLLKEVENITAHHELNRYTVTSSPIRNPLELHVRVKRMLESAVQDLPQPGADRVH